MAIPLVKLTFVVGSGIVGSIIVKEGHISDVPSFISGAFKEGHISDVPSFISGAFKIVRKHLQEDKSKSSSASKAGSEYIMSQVNSLRQQLQHLQASGPVTIVTKSRRVSGTSSITCVAVIGAVSYGYIWWKGWKLSDMMFVTKRGLSDACGNVAKQLDLVSSSVSTAKKHLSNRIDRVDCSLQDCLEVTVATKEEVSELHGDLSGFHVEVESVHRAVQSLESKLSQIEGSQDFTTQGVYHLCQFVKKLDSKKPEHTPILRSHSFRPALELSQNTPVTRADSLPPIVAAIESVSPSTPAESPRVLQSSRTATPLSLKEAQGLSSIARIASLRPSPKETAESSGLTNGVSPASNGSNGSTSSSSSSVRFGWRLSSISILTRTRSTTDS